LAIKKKKVKKKSKTGRSAGKTKKKLPCKYVVKKGDSISKIAKKFYGSSAKKYRELIWKANKKKMQNPSDIKKGMKLRIPKKG
jgi:nucleoid-associated protein YgaU